MPGLVWFWPGILVLCHSVDNRSKKFERNTLNQISGELFIIILTKCNICFEFFYCYFRVNKIMCSV